MATSPNTCPHCNRPNTLVRHCESRGCPPWLRCIICGLRVDYTHGVAVDKDNNPVRLQRPGAET